MGKKKDERQYYLGNKNLPKGTKEFEWSPAMVKDLKKCKKNVLYFAENFFHIVSLDKGRELIKLYKCQKRVLRSLRDNRFNVVLASRQIGKSTLMMIYCLWVVCFQEDQRVLIVANKEQTAIELFRRVRLAYEMLPNYLKSGVVEWGKTGLQLANGSSIGISTTSSDAGRGQSVNVLVLDELAHIDSHLLDKFWASVYPIISASKKSKILVASTPCGTDSLFHMLYTDAVKNDNGWKAERVDWWEIPGRDDRWKEQTMATIGSLDAWRQEFECEFLETGESVIDDVIFEKLKKECCDPKFVFDEGKYMLWEEAKKDHLYAVGVDISEGIGEAASVVQIFDITDLTNIRQVAVYHNRGISPYNFTTRLYEILQNWGSPPVAIERNNCGAQVVDNIINLHGYTNLINFAPKNNQSTNYNKRIGVVAHTNTKYKGVMNMRYWINTLDVVKIRDINTINELKTFVRYPNGSWAAKKENDCWDDRVMSLVWSLIVLENSVTERYYEVVQVDDNQRPLVLRSLEFGTKLFVDPLSMYSNEKLMGENSNPLPMVFDTYESDGESDKAELEAMGWKVPEGMKF